MLQEEMKEHKFEVKYFLNCELVSIFKEKCSIILIKSLIIKIKIERKKNIYLFFIFLKKIQ